MIMQASADLLGAQPDYSLPRLSQFAGKPLSESETATGQFALFLLRHLSRRITLRQTPLMTAMHARRYEAARHMLSVGANVDAQDLLGETALMKSIRAQDLTATSGLLLYKPQLGIVNLVGENALFIAAECAHASLLELVLDAVTAGGTIATVDANAADRFGDTLMHRLLKSGKLSIHAKRHRIGMLLEHAAMRIDLTRRDNAGRSLLDVACGLPELALARLLLTWGAPVETGVGALHAAISRGDRECLLMLLDAGMSPNQRNSEQQSPLATAFEHSQFDCFRLLLDRGALLPPLEKLDQHLDPGKRQDA